MQPYGTRREHPMDNKRRYLNSAMSHEDRREERRDKRAARTEGKAAIVEQITDGDGMDADDLAHERDREDGLLLTLDEWERAAADLGANALSHAALTEWLTARRWRER